MSVTFYGGVFRVRKFSGGKSTVVFMHKANTEHTDRASDPQYFHCFRDQNRFVQC